MPPPQEAWSTCESLAPQIFCTTAHRTGGAASARLSSSSLDAHRICDAHVDGLGLQPDQGKTRAGVFITYLIPNDMSRYTVPAYKFLLGRGFSSATQRRVLLERGQPEAIVGVFDGALVAGGGRAWTVRRRQAELSLHVCRGAGRVHRRGGAAVGVHDRRRRRRLCTIGSANAACATRPSSNGTARVCACVPRHPPSPPVLPPFPIIPPPVPSSPPHAPPPPSAPQCSHARSTRRHTIQSRWRTRSDRPLLSGCATYRLVGVLY